LTKEVNDPSEEFVKFILGEIYDGIKTKVIIDKFTPVVKRGFRQFIADQVNSKLNAALNTSVSVEDLEVPQVEANAEEEEDIITTEAEIEAFTTTKLLLKDTIDTSRIFYRDNKSYFNIILDNNIRKWVLRLYINNARTYFVINDEEKTSIEIVDVIDIFNHADKIIPVVERYL
ncbi:type I restriction endonuclease, partial [Listeria monocytogenes]